MPRRKGRIACLAAALALLAGADAAAQGVKLTRVGGAIELGTELAHQETKSASGPTRTFDRYRFREEIEIATDGWLVTSQFLAFHLGGSFGLRQEILEGSNSSGNTNTMLIGYDGILNLFPTKPLSLMLFANRFEDQMIQNFGTDTESLSESFGATLRFSNPVFPSTVSLQQLHSSSESDNGFFTSKRDETRQFVEYNGSHTSEALQVRLSGRAEDIDDESAPPVGDYRVYDADATVGYRWGPYFEKYFRATGGYFERQGDFDFRNASQAAAFYWSPTDSLDTSLEQSLDLSESSGQESNTYMGVFSADHQLYESLRTNFNFVYEHADQTIGIRDSYTSNLGLDYEKELPWNSRLLMDLSGRYRYEDRDFADVQAINTSENLPVVDFTGNFLSQRNVDPASIEVFEGPGGAQLVEGFDYAIDVIGDLTSIDVLPGGTIEIGDAVFVNYVYQSDPSARTSRPGFRFGVAWDAGWIALRYEHDQDDEKLIEGEDQPLQHLRRDAVRLDLIGDWGWIDAAANAQYLTNDTGSTEYDEISFGQELGWKPRPGMHVTAIVRESQRNFRRPNRDQRTITAGLSAYWQVTPRSNLRLHCDFRDMNNSDSLDQRDAGVGARGNLRFGKIEVTPTFVWTRRQRGESVSNDVRGVLSLRRSF